MFDTVDFLEKNLDRQISFVRASESRLQFLLPALTICLGAWATGFAYCDLGRPTVVLFGVFSLVGFVISVYFSWDSMYPRTNGAKASMIFFGGIASHSVENYSQKALNITAEDYKADLIEQIHINSKIALSKYKSVQLSMTFWYLSLPFLILFLSLSIREIRIGTGL